MNRQRIVSIALVTALASCTSGPPAPPSLGYRVPAVSEATYVFEDETVVTISAMGQSLELRQDGTAQYGVTFSESAQGVGVSMRLLDLSATLTQPMGPGLEIDESQVEGLLEFSLDRRGNASVILVPTVQVEASQMVSGTNLAHTFFPGLPGRAVAVGDEWVDTVAYEGDEGAGSISETSVFTYRVTGDTVVAGKSLLTIAFEGDSRSSAAMEVSGMAVSQSSEVQVEGHVLWDHQAGLMVESLRRGMGSGTVAVPIAPTPLPIRIETTRRTRLEEG